MLERIPLGAILPGLLILTLTISTNVAAQVRAIVSVPMPAPTFAGLQKLLTSPIGASLLADNPQMKPFQQVVLMVPSAPTLQALGPLAAHLPADFSARIEAVRTSGSAAPLAAVLAQAYAASAPMALAEIDARMIAAVETAASDANAWRSLGSEVSGLKSYSLYGKAAQERVALFQQKVATVRSQKLAKNLSRALQTGLREPASSAEGIPAGFVDEKSFARRHSRLLRATPPSAAPQALALWRKLLAAAKKSTAADVKRLLAARGPKQHKVLANTDTKTIIEYTGVPLRVEELKDYGKVYRHWVRDLANLDKILKSGLLRAGPVAYVEFTGSSHAYIKETFIDIHGAFFTDREHLPGEPRVMHEEVGSYVDFRIPDGVKALSLDGETVMVIPAKVGTSIPIEIVGSSGDSARPGANLRESGIISLKGL